MADPTEAAVRRQRLAAALRANLARRKAGDRVVPEAPPAVADQPER